MTDELNNPVDQPTETPASGEAALGGEQVAERPAASVVPTPVPEQEPEVASAASEGGQGAEGTSGVEEAAQPAGVVAAPETPAEVVAEPAAADAAASEKPAKPAGKKGAKKAEPKAAPQGPKSDKMQWYILKVQSNREESIREGLLRRIAIAGLDEFVGDVIVPVEKVTEFKGGKRRVTKRKLYPGYLVVQMEINEDTWFVVRETPGIGDFTGASGHPTTMQPHEVARILAKKDEKTDEAPKLDIKFHAGDRVKINEGTFDNFEGEVDSIDQTNGRVTVMINIFGRSTPVELEYWQIESI